MLISTSELKASSILKFGVFLPEDTSVAHVVK